MCPRGRGQRSWGTALESIRLRLAGVSQRRVIARSRRIFVARRSSRLRVPEAPRSEMSTGGPDRNRRVMHLTFHVHMLDAPQGGVTRLRDGALAPAPQGVRRTRDPVGAVSGCRCLGVQQGAMRK